MLPKVIIDTDIGDDIDDSFALLLSILSEKMEILGITTCFRDTFKRAQIVKALLKTLNKNIDVYAGSTLPMNNQIVYADFDKFDINGNVIMPYYFEEMSTYKIPTKSAIDFIIETANLYPNEVTIISIGPLTNLAKVMQKDLKSFNKIKDILFMGGQPTTSFKEWNIRCDVEAACLVFSGKVPMKSVGLNVTSKCKLSKNAVDNVLNSKSNSYDHLLSKMAKAYLDFFKGNRLPVMHDPLTIACMLGDFCEFKKCKIDIELEGKNRGQSIVNPHSKNQTIEVAYAVDEERFLEYLSSTISIDLLS